MKIRLTMQGGIYGVQQFEPVDAADVDIPEDLQALLQPAAGPESANTEQRAAGDEPGAAEEKVAEDSAAEEEQEARGSQLAEGLRTERQTYQFEVSYDDGSSKTFSFGESALSRDPRLKDLFERVWRHAKPVRGE